MKFTNINPLPLGNALKIFPKVFLRKVSVKEIPDVVPGTFEEVPVKSVPEEVVRTLNGKPEKTLIHEGYVYRFVPRHEVKKWKHKIPPPLPIPEYYTRQFDFAPKIKKICKEKVPLRRYMDGLIWNAQRTIDASDIPPKWKNDDTFGEVYLIPGEKELILYFARGGHDFNRLNYKIEICKQSGIGEPPALHEIFKAGEITIDGIAHY